MKIITLGDKLVIAGFIVLAIISVQFLPNGDDGPSEGLIVTVEGKEQFVSTEKDRTIRIGGGDEGCVLEIREGKARIERSKCPDQICVLRGWIERKGDVIICLPHKVMVEMAGPSDGLDVRIQ